MSYQSIEFLGFTAIVLAVYYLIGRKWQIWVLALANLAFYAAAGVRYLPFILATMASTYWAARSIGRVYGEADEQLAQCRDAAQKKQVREASKRRAKRALALGMLLPIGLLSVCKYTGFVTENVNAVLSHLSIPQIPTFRLILPLGISFYTFMALSYLLDVYWKRYKAEENFLYYAVYLSYFPHVVQGPIDRFNEFRAQLSDGIAFDYRGFTFGAQLTLWGFFKKLVVADTLGLFVDTVFKKWQTFRGFELILAIVAYSIQIYADFSGCIDIVTGISEMFGIRLRKNFNHPYFSRTMAEFWRRWHISLQEWFKDYVYFPVSASRFSKDVRKRLKNAGKTRAAELFASCFPILVVWMVTGIWHGAAWKFVAWGLFHAALLISGKVLEPAFARINRRLRIDTERLPWRLWQMARTFILCCVGRVFFRASDINAAVKILRRMTKPRINLSRLVNGSVSYGVTTSNVIVAVVSIVILVVVDAIQERTPLREALSKRNIALRWALIYACLFCVLIFGIYGAGYGDGGFIYEKF